MPEIVGRVVTRKLSSVQPNDWNFNEMPPHIYESLKRGLDSDGWMASQTLSIWGKDEKGQKQNKIIDGEHRWNAAQEVGFEKAPMVFFDGLTRAEAIAHTVKFAKRHGEADRLKLRSAVQYIDVELPESDLDIELGFSPTELSDLMADPVEPVVKAPKNDKRSASSSVTQVQLSFDEKQLIKWRELTGKLMELNEVESVSELALLALTIWDEDLKASTQ